MRCKKKLFVILLIFMMLILFGIKVLPLFLPIQYCVKELPQNVEEYLIIEGIKTTGYDWHIIGDKEGLFPKGSMKFQEITIDGDLPIYRFFSDYSPGKNRFICYGEYVYQPYDGVQGHNINGEYVYNVDHWDIMYPVHRDLFIGVLIPRGYLCRYDYCYAKGYTFREMLDGLYIWNYKTLPYDK